MTTTATQRWKQADNETKSSVFGYIRRIEKSGKGWNIPLGIKYCCIDYYFLREYFTKHGDNIKVSKNKTLAEVSTNRHRRQTLYGNVTIDLAESDDVKHHNRWKWTFKVSQSDPESFGFWIGINNSNKTVLNDAISYSGIKYQSYTLTNHGCLLPIGCCYESYDDAKWGAEAIIEMVVEKKSLTFYTNSILTHSSFISDSTYHLAVVLSEKGQKIELLKFEH